jgi:2-iminobutanoate/2-iminopropanoate deaminase
MLRKAETCNFLREMLLSAWLVALPSMCHMGPVSCSLRYVSRSRYAMEDHMAKDIICTPNAPSSTTYSQAVRASGFVFVSGTGPQDPVTGKIVGDTIQEQTRQCLQNISAILEAAGSSLDRVVSVTVILLEEADFAGMNEEWTKWFPANPPARQGARLPVRIPGMRVSIAAIAEA